MKYTSIKLKKSVLLLGLIFSTTIGFDSGVYAQGQNNYVRPSLTALLGLSPENWCQNNEGGKCAICTALGASSTSSNVIVNPATPGCTTPGNSKIINATGAYIHWAMDYKVGAPDVSGCVPCGGEKALMGEMPTLHVNRYHRYRYGAIQSSFGQTAFWGSLDNHMRLSTGNIRWYAPELQDEWTFLTFDSTRNFWHDYQDHNVLSVRLYDDVGTELFGDADDPTVDKAVLRFHNGREEVYEAFTFNGQRYARLITHSDRNGNSLTINYVYDNNASDTELGGDRSKLWQKSNVIDAYGRTATVHYGASPVDGIWSISQIDLPNGSSLLYQYGQLDVGDGAKDMLIGVTYPDGTQTTISSVYDPTNQTQAVTYQDAGASDVHRNKTVHFSTPTWTDPQTGVTKNYSAKRVRMVVNGAGEVTYASRYDYNGALSIDTIIYEGGNRVLGIDFDNGNVRQVYRATAYDWSTAADTWTWEEIINTSVFNGEQRLLDRKDPNGRQTLYTRAAYTGDVTSKIYPDGSSNSKTYNNFSQILNYIDRIGRQTLHTYDSLGNRLTKTVGAGTPEAGTYTYIYNSRGLVTSKRDPLYNAANPDLHVTDYVYDTNGYRIQEIQAADISGGIRPIITHTYDTAGRRIATTDQRGRVTSFAYDSRDRPTSTTYNDGSTENIVYGVGINANLVDARQDRNGNVTAYVYDGAGRETQRTKAFGTPEAVVKTSTYLTGTDKVLTSVNRGERTDYAYDFYNRKISTTRYPKPGTTLSNTTVYDDLSRRIETQDAYGRRTYFLYDVNDRLTRTVREIIPGALTVPAFTPQATVAGTSDANGTTTTYSDTRSQYIAGLARDLNGNPSYVITDRIHDAAGQVLTKIDGRGISHTTVYDSRGRRIQSTQAASAPAVAALTSYIYDLADNLIEVQHPRFVSEGIASTDHFTYTGRNLKASHTVAQGSSIEATETFTYYLDGRAETHTDFRGNTSTTLWHGCCGRFQGTIDRDGVSGHISNTDFQGNITHTAIVSDLSAGENYTFHDPVGADTLNEFTSRFDGLNRPTYSTKWLVPQGFILDEARSNLGNGSIPIAGEDGVPAADGLTTQYTYDEDLSDGAGIDATYSAQLSELSSWGITFGVDADGYGVAATNPEGETTVVLKDGLGRTVATILGDGNIGQAILYDQVINNLVVTTTIDALNHRKSVAVDGNGITRESTDALNQVSTQIADANRNIISRRDPNGVGLDCIYDERNRDIICTDTQGDSRSKTYDANNNVVAKTDGLGKTDFCTFDERDRQYSCTNRINITVVYTHDANNNRTGIIDGEGNVTAYEFDVRNLLVKTTFVDSGEKQCSYDAARRRVSCLDQANEITGYVYDMANRITMRVYPDNKNDMFMFDGANRLASAVSQRYENSVTRTYNDDGTLLSETLTVVGQLYTIGHVYDIANRLIECVYPDGRKVENTWTDRNQLDDVSFSGTQVANFVYDIGTRETTRTLGNSLIQTKTYRADNLIDGITVSGIIDFDYTYDANKRKLTEDDGINNALSQDFSYDDEDRLTNWTSNGTVLTQAQAFNLSLEGDWNSTTINGVAQTRTHNGVHETTTVGSNTLAYTPEGNLTTNSSGDNYTWDFDNRMKTITTSASAVNTSYAYDALGRRVSKTVGSVQTVYAYCHNRVIAEYTGDITPPGGVGGHGVKVQKWTGIGGDNIVNLTSHADYPNNPDLTYTLPNIDTGTHTGNSYGIRVRGYLKATQTGDYTFWVAGDNGVRLLLSSDETAANAVQIAYHNGWTSYKQYTKSSTQQSASITLQAGEYYYIEGLQKEGAGGDSLSVAWEGPGVTSRTEIPSTFLYTYEGPFSPGGGSGVPTAENPTRVFVYGSYVDEPVMMEQDGSDYYYHANRQYSVAAITDDAGTLVERYGYDSYGKLTVVTDDTNFKQPYFFTGRRLDDESGLYYFRARYYDAELGRFISRDPLGYVDGLNLYGGYFVPLGVDPSGMNSVECCEDTEPPEDVYCCEEWQGFWQVGGHASVLDCAYDVLAGTWYGDYLAALTFTAGTAAAEAALAYAASQAGVTLWNGGVAGAGIIGGGGALLIALDTCMRWQCTRSREATCVCTDDGLIFDTYECDCGNDILVDSPNAQQDGYSTLDRMMLDPEGPSSETFWE